MASSLWLDFMKFLVYFSLMINSINFCKADPTEGFISLPLTNENFAVDKPYNIPLSDCYSYVDGVHRLIVHSTDMPFKVGSPTDPRTEIRIKGYDYSSGIWQFEGYVFVPNGTSGTSIMQVHRSDGSEPATDLMLMIYNGKLWFYKRQIVEDDFYDRWVKVNVIHDVEENNLVIFIDDIKKLEVNGKGKSDFFFKCGVYAQRDSSNYMESKWKDIKIYKKNM